MKKFVKIFSLVFAVIIANFTLFTLVGCSADELQEATKTSIETATDLIPIEYSTELAKNVYLTAVNKSKRQTTIKADVQYRQLENGSAISSVSTIKAYWKNENNKTQAILDYTDTMGSIYYVSNIDNTYYTFNSRTHKYTADMDCLSWVEGAFTMLDKIYGGLCYGDGNSRIMVKVSDSIYASIIIKNGLIVGCEGTELDHNGVVVRLSNMTYEYNFKSNIFDNVPTSLAGWTLENE